MVLERYGRALCFLEVFEWWYYSGTPEVRMRYAHKFMISSLSSEFIIYINMVMIINMTIIN